MNIVYDLQKNIYDIIVTHEHCIWPPEDYIRYHSHTWTLYMTSRSCATFASSVFVPPRPCTMCFKCYWCMYITCMYVCMYVCVCGVYMCIICVGMYACMCVRMHAYICVYLCIYVVCTYLSMCMYVCSLSICMYVCMHLCKYAHMHSSLYACDTRTQAYTRIRSLFSLSLSCSLQ